MALFIACVVFSIAIGVAVAQLIGIVLDRLNDKARIARAVNPAEGRTIRYSKPVRFVNRPGQN